MSIFTNITNEQKLIIANSMMDSVVREIYRLCSMLAIDPETFVPSEYGDPTETFDPLTSNPSYGEKQSLYEMCKKYAALTEQVQSLSS
jgi:hypothetical protein